MPELSIILFWSGYFLAPGFPNLIVREIIAIFLAFILPRMIVSPINHITLIIFPPIIKFEEKLEKYEKIRTILPRFIAAEVILMITGIVLITISRFI